MKEAYNTDYIVLALNFFVTRIESSSVPPTEEETKLIQKIREDIDENIGKY
jgi:hypothetical protein